MRRGGVVGNLLSVICLMPHRQWSTDNRKLFISCAQTVASVRVQGVQNPGLYTRLFVVLQACVQKITSYTMAVVGDFRVVFHGQNRYFNPVREVVIPIVHTTNKCNNKIFINYFSY